MLAIQRLTRASFLRRTYFVLIGATLPLIMFTGLTAGAGPQGSKSAIPAIQNRMTLKCQFSASTTMTGDSEIIKGEAMPGDGLVIFSVIDSKLVIVAADGGEPLHLLSTNPISGAMYFAELTPAGNIALWSFHRVKERRVLFIKQNNYVLGPNSQVLVWNHAGYCDATGGNGQPLGK